MHSNLSVTSQLNGESGHAMPAIGSILGAAGLIALGIGAANDTGWLAVVGGIVAAVGFVGYDLLRHMKLDYPVYDRLDKLEGKK